MNFKILIATALAVLAGSLVRHFLGDGCGLAAGVCVCALLKTWVEN